MQPLQFLQLLVESALHAVAPFLLLGARAKLVGIFLIVGLTEFVLDGAQLLLQEVLSLLLAQVIDGLGADVGLDGYQLRLLGEQREELVGALLHRADLEQRLLVGGRHREMIGDEVDEIERVVDIVDCEKQLLAVVAHIVENLLGELSYRRGKHHKLLVAVVGHVFHIERCLGAEIRLFSSGTEKAHALPPLQNHRGGVVGQGENLDYFGHETHVVNLLKCGVNMFHNLDVLGNVTIGPVRLLGMSIQEAEARAIEYLRLVGLSGKLHAMSSQLSGGEKQRVEIARCLAMEPEVILFDEPTSALDQMMATEVFRVIQELAKRDMTMVIVTHALEFARSVSTRILFMCDGLIYEDGTPEQIFEHPQYTVTRLFIRDRMSLIFKVENREYDLYKINAEIEFYCQKHHFGKKYFTLELITEELLTNFLPFSGPINFRIFVDDNKQLAIEVEQENCSENIIESPEKDEISRMILEGLCQTLTETQFKNNRLISIVVGGDIN